jgi:hypothetical protein
MDEFSDYLSHLVSLPGELLLQGDFNFHMDDVNDSDAAAFADMLQSFGLTQHVREVTHEKGHTLDLTITRTDASLLLSTRVRDLCISDHFPVFVNVDIPKIPNPVREVVYRRTRSIDPETLERLIAASPLSAPPGNWSLTELVDSYGAELESILDQVAPVCIKKIPLRTNAAWYNDNIRIEKQRRRRAETKWRKTKSLDDRQHYRQAHADVQALIDAAKREFYQGKVAACMGDTRKLFGIVNSLLGKTFNCPLPTSDVLHLADRFSDFFIEKIRAIQSTIPRNTSSPNLPQQTISTTLDAFSTLSLVDVRALLAHAPCKTCELDPFPTSLVKSTPSLHPVIVEIVNRSLNSGVFPDSFKSAIVRPLLKKPSLDREQLKNYRPVSNLAFVSKVIEKAVAQQLNSHLQINALMEPMQSAYRAGHSTETALLSIQNDVLQALGEREAVLLVLLDLSAAFDTVDHALLLQTLARLGIRGSALDWFRSYLTGRSQVTRVGLEKSNPAPLSCGVPQGSVLGPILFTVYTASLGELLRQHHISYHLYADDSQLWIRCNPRNPHRAAQQMESCIASVQSWMATHFLKMNAEKTEFLVISSAKMSPKIPPLCVSVGNCELKPSSKARNLGVIINSHASMNDQISSVCRSSYLQLRCLRKIQRFVSREALEKLVHAFVTSKLDYCNALYIGIPRHQLQRLQRVQNCAARLLAGADRSDHITPILRDLHWLPVEQRVQFKITLLVYKAITGRAPKYLCDLIKVNVPKRTLRSNNDLQLFIPFTRSHLVKNSCFSFIGPYLFNCLPSHVKHSDTVDSFKRNLKTHLFSICFMS